MSQLLPFIEHRIAMATVITDKLLDTKIKENLDGVEFVKATDQSDGCGGKASSK